MPKLRPQFAEETAEKRPFFAEEISDLHRRFLPNAPRMPNLMLAVSLRRSTA